ncbi:MAG: DUF2116 family Zn-ribbon domain-containing protein [Methanobacterium sp.]
MTEPHKHCPICGTSIPMDERFCSTKCLQEYNARERKIQKTRRIWYIVMAIILIALFLYVFRGKLF